MKHKYSIISSDGPKNPKVGLSKRHLKMKCVNCGFITDKYEWYADGYWASMAPSIILTGDDDNYKSSLLSCEEYIMKQVLE
jgi:hypothetical protein